MDAPDSDHPSDQTLRAYGVAKLYGSLADSVHSHLSGCGECRQRVAEMSDDTFLGRQGDAQARPDSPAQVGRPFTSMSNTEGSPSSIKPRPDSSLPARLAELPDYEIVGELGRGGMGVVYLAGNKLMGRKEVLKVVSRELIDRRGVFDRFLREIRNAAQLHHPNIVTAYSAIRAGESIVFAMEYVEGHDLSQLVKRSGPLPVAHACNFIYQAALGLQYAHEQGMVHRDIKPSNLILARHGKKPVLKVLDFGLAKATREGPMDQGLTHEGQMLGTPDYIAPEQSLDAHKADIRADIYSMGCTLYYLLTGGPPFRGTSLYEVLQAHHSLEAKPLNLVRPDVPWELAAVVAKMMAKEPDRRYQSPGEVAQALKPYFQPAEAPPAGSLALVSQMGPQTAGERDFRSGSGPARPANTAPAAQQPACGTTVKSPQPESTWQSLPEMADAEPSSSDIKAVAATRRRPHPPWLWPAVAAAVLLLGLSIAWAAGIVKFKTRDGVIVLEHVPENAVVEVDGDRITVIPTTGEPVMIEARAGKHVVVVKRGGDVLLGESVTLESGKQFKLAVRFETPTKLSSGSPKDDGAESTGTAKNDVRADAGPAVETAGPHESIKNSIGMTFRSIPSGEFSMGSPDDATVAQPVEQPSHRVRITKPFYVGVHEVTQAQYKAVMGTNPSYFASTGGGRDRVAGQSTDRYPADGVSWLDAVRFCNVLSEKEGKKPFYEIGGKDIRVPNRNGLGYRLPTEAEWEYACRANAPTPARYSFGDDVQKLGEYGWFNGNSDSRTHPVGQKRPNGFGLHDMHGNVEEWCWDWFGLGHYSQSVVDDPTGPTGASIDRVGDRGNAECRIFRGGCCNTPPDFTRSASRNWHVPGYRSRSLGLRLALGQSGR